MAFRNHGRNAGYQHKPNDAGPGQDVAKGKVAGNGSATNGDGKGEKQADDGASGRSDAIMMGGDNQQSDRKPFDPDADEKLNNGSCH